MDDLLIRLALFTVLPVALGAAIVIFDRTATGPVRRVEAFLVPLFLIGVGGHGIAGFIAHVFISDPVARSIGWEPGGPFQPLVGFALLAIGLIGAVSSEWRGGFRDATVAAVAVFGIGAAVVPLMFGNTVLNLATLVVPALLVWFTLALRRGEEAEPPTIILRGWMIPVRRGSVVAGTVAAWGYLLGYPTGQPVVLALAAIAVSAVAFWWIVSRAKTHRVSAT